MALKTSLIIAGDSSGGVQAVDALSASLQRAGDAATKANAPLASLDGAQNDVATSARDSAAAIGEQDQAQRKAATSAGELARTNDASAAAQTAAATAAREATAAATTYSQASVKAADDGRRAAAANDNVATGAKAVAEQLTGVREAQKAAASGAEAHASAIGGLQAEFAAMVADVASGRSAFDVMAERGGAVAAVLEKVAASSRGAGSAVGDAGDEGKDAGVDLGGLADTAQDLAGKVEGVGGKFGAMAGIIAGPVGAAIGFALSIGSELLAQYIATGNAIDDEVEKLKQSAAQAAITAKANEAFSHTQEGLAESVRQLTEDIKKQNESLRTNAELKNIDARRKLADLQNDPNGVRSELANAQRDLAIARATAGLDPTGSKIVADAVRRVGTAQQAVDQLNANIATAQATVQQTRVLLAQENAKGVDDAIKGINKRYDLEAARLTERKNREIALGREVGAATQRQFEDIERRRNKDLADEEERQRKAAAKPRHPATPSLGSQVSSDQSADLLAIARRYAGLSENSVGDRNTLSGLFAKANVNVDPRMVAWCAAFVNSVLAADGIKGTGSNLARSFLGFGEATAKPNKGDIVVSKRGDNPAEGHVGFYEGTDAKGRILVLGGNTGNRVATAAIDRSDVLGFRRAPMAADQYADQQKVAADALKEQRQALAEVTQRWLPAVQAAKDYADEIAKIDALAKSYDAGKPGSGLSPVDAAAAKAAVTAARDKRLADLAVTPEAKAADDAKKAIDGVIGSIQRETAARAAADPVERAMIQHREELAKLAAVDPAAAAAREAELRAAYQQADAMARVEDATREAAQAQAASRDLALDAFDAILVRGEKVGDVIDRVAKSLASAAIEASIFGTGPLAALLKSAPTIAGGGGATAGTVPGGQGAADLVGKSVGKAVGDRLDGVFGKGNGAKVLANAGYGAAAASVTGGSALAGSVGGAIGGEVGKKLLSGFLGSAAGPLGAIAGGLLGGIAGKLLTTTKTGSASLSNVNGSAGISGSAGNSSAYRKASEGLANAVGDSIDSIVKQLGGELGDFAVSIGKKGDKYVVDNSGRGSTSYGKANDGITAYASAEEAQAAALANALADGAVKGVSAAVAQALRSSSDVNKAVTEALKVQNLELAIGGVTAEIDKAFRDFETTAAERVRIAKQYGFDLVAIEKKNAEDRAKVATDLAKKQVGSLQSLVDEITQGALFEGTALDKIATLNTAIEKAKADLANNVEGAGDTLAGLYQQRLATTKDAYGTTSGYSSALNTTLDEARATIARTNAQIAAAQEKASDPALATTNAALDENNDQNARIIAGLADNTSLLSEISETLANGGGGSLAGSARLAALAAY